MSKNLLTIDWDFFINASLEERTVNFPRVPDGEIGCKPNNSLWNTSDFKAGLYKNDLSDIVSSILKMNKSFDKFYISENHGEVYNIFEECSGFKSIVNIDFHHDMYLGTSHICCDNWCTHLKNKYNFEYFWVKRTDSVTSTFGEEVDAKAISFYRVLKLIESGYFKTIHLCRSDLYSPPKFDSEFNYLMNSIKIKSTEFKTLGNALDRR